MGIIDDMKNCQSCAERREAIKKHFAAMQEWFRNPLSRPPILGEVPPARRFGMDGKPLPLDEKLDKSS